MKHLVVLLAFSFLCLPDAGAQYRGFEPKPPSVMEKISSAPDQNLILGLINPENFSMSHSVSMSYVSMGSAGLGVTRYTNSMFYRISEPLTLRADVGFMFSPFGSAAGLLKNDVNQIYLESAQLDYRPSKDFSLSVQFRQLPTGFMYPYSGMYGDPQYGTVSPFQSEWP